MLKRIKMNFRNIKLHSLTKREITHFAIQCFINFSFFLQRSFFKRRSVPTRWRNDRVLRGRRFKIFIHRRPPSLANPILLPGCANCLLSRAETGVMEHYATWACTDFQHCLRAFVSASGEGVSPAKSCYILITGVEVSLGRLEATPGRGQHLALTGVRNAHAGFLLLDCRFRLQMVGTVKSVCFGLASICV